MATLTVHLRGMSGSIDLEIPSESATAADVRAQAGLGENVGLAVGGERISRDAESSTPIAPEATVTTLPPEVKAGA